MMSAAACFLLFSGLVAVLGPPVLRRLTHGGLAPCLGVIAWSAATASVVLSWSMAALLLVLDIPRYRTGPGGSLLGACLARLQASIGGADTAFEVAGVAAATAVVSITVWITGRLAVGLMRLRIRTHGHARRARLIGHRVRGVDAVVIDNAERAAYCAAGRPHAVVITTAALAALDARQVQAVLAHERAHLAGHHAQILAVLRVLAASLPGMTLFTAGAVEVGRLLEMCADDSAARVHGSSTLLSGLIALCAPAQVPDGALGAGNIALLDRAGRLASPPRPAEKVRVRLLTAAVVAAVTVTPLALAALEVTGTMWCLPMTS
ncbi:MULTISPECIES: M56 family metallopeptidase [unclassified Rhodococcus (in: high G+C Gram-positive bacteria)]|uniref:M56 family metallopeptidase n=1 Tax=unclassified Rhodococcus (in: high G+C Gram-positive bacteria) TaxID=192944 RepID=UPI002078B9EB|nr:MULTISPECIES: M56 family metallopeptidase [unclassified Rhodococcus (in: high G+C Gram-positive bacteria)]